MIKPEEVTEDNIEQFFGEVESLSRDEMYETVRTLLVATVVGKGKPQYHPDYVVGRNYNPGGPENHPITQRWLVDHAKDIMIWSSPEEKTTRK